MDSLPPEPIQFAAPGIKRPLRVLIASHSHPEVSNGGAEISAFQLYRGLQMNAACRAWYLGCDRTVGVHKPGVVLSQPSSVTEYLYSSGAFDWFKFANGDLRFRTEIERLFAEIQPDVVHFHHYINFGMEVFLHLKRVAPACKIVLTLHEYLAICHHYGQMVTKDHQTLCYQPTPAQCHECFPVYDRSDFFLRKRYIQRFLDLVDVFISPSEFLAERYVAWGIPRVKMVRPRKSDAGVIADAGATAARGWLAAAWVFWSDLFVEGHRHFVRCGKNARRKPEQQGELRNHGDYRGQPPPFQEAFLARLKQAGMNVRYHGPYDRLRVDRLMQSVHAVLMPSIWWENSPVVIQEALRNKRPVICSDIGGMAEKVRPGIDGFHFTAGSAVALASLINQFSEEPERLARVGSAMTGLPRLVSTMEDYLAVYRGESALFAQSVG